jgi:hypothetical protein
MKLSARWTCDCCGKQDYDGELVVLSTRYWPRGGGYLLLNHGKIEGNESRPDVKPSARSAICINDGDSDDYIELVAKDFEADTEEDVKSQVEAWAQQRFNRIVDVLRREFQLEARG